MLNGRYMSVFLHEIVCQFAGLCGQTFTQHTSSSSGEMNGSWLRWSVPVVDDSIIWQPGFDLLGHYWALLNHFRTNQGHCTSCRKKWALQQSTCALVTNGKWQSQQSHIVNSCPLSKLEGRGAAVIALRLWMAEVIWLINGLDNTNNRLCGISTYGLIDVRTEISAPPVLLQWPILL